MCLRVHNHACACDCIHQHILPFRKGHGIVERRMMWEIQRLSILRQESRFQIEFPMLHSPAVNIQIKNSSSLNQ